MEPILGQIQIFPFNYAPMGWLPCDGRILNINSNQALFSLVGAIYGGNGTTTFAVPNLKNATPYPYPNCMYYIATQGIYPMRQ